VLSLAEVWILRVSLEHLHLPQVQVLIRWRQEVQVLLRCYYSGAHQNGC